MGENGGFARRFDWLGSRFGKPWNVRSIGIGSRHYRPLISIVLDPGDDIAVLKGIVAHCHQDSRRIAISPGPGTFGSGGLYTHATFVLQEVGVEGRERSENDRRLLAKCAIHGHRSILDLGKQRAFEQARVSELYVLRAQAISAAVWRNLGDLNWWDAVKVFLVVHGQLPTAQQLKALRGCHVRYINGDRFRTSKVHIQRCTLVDQR